ncbi:hypothetical protein GCM10009791_30500 [Citricoccus zhacaiensis]
MDPNGCSKYSSTSRRFSSAENCFEGMTTVMTCSICQGTNRFTTILPTRDAAQILVSILEKVEGGLLKICRSASATLHCGLKRLATGSTADF